MGTRDSDRRRGLSGLIHPWYRGVDPVSVRVSCSNGTHTITWREGRLILEDHDPDAEHAISGLGGEIPECLEVLEAWTSRETLVLTGALLTSPHSRSIEGMTRADWRERSIRIQQAVSRTGAGGYSSYDRMKQLLDSGYYTTVLSSLPPELRERFAMELAARALSAMEEGGNQITRESRYMLEPALEIRANPALEEAMRSWRRAGDYAILTTECWLIAEGTEPSIFGWMSAGGGFCAASLPFSWLTTIYARSAHVVDGCFILDALDADEDATNITVIAVRWERPLSTVPTDLALAQIATAPGDKIERHFKDRWVPVAAEARISRRNGGWTLSWHSRC